MNVLRISPVLAPKRLQNLVVLFGCKGGEIVIRRTVPPQTGVPIVRLPALDVGQCLFEPCGGRDVP